MKVLALALVLSCAALPALADIIVLHDGTSYSGHYTPAGDGKLSFTDNQGIHYDLPVGDVQSLVFSNAADHLTLRNGKTYTGQLNGNGMISPIGPPDPGTFRFRCAKHVPVKHRSEGGVRQPGRT